jgi:hypothetical protein
MVVIVGILKMLDMETKQNPRMAKAHSRLVATEYLRLGWTLRKEFYAEGDGEPYEYLFIWDRPEEPKHIDWGTFLPPKTK